jgi:hypothetical protein
MTKQYRVVREWTTEFTTYVFADSEDEAEAIAMRLSEEQFTPTTYNNHPDWYSDERLGEWGDVNCVEEISK